MDLGGILSGVEIKIPVYIVLAYLAIISLCLLIKRVQMGLATSFLFLLYVGYVYNRPSLIEALKGSPVAIALYAGLALVIIILAVISFLSSPK